MGNCNIYKNALNISHCLARCRVKPGDRVIDATCGRGHDTAFLAELVGDRGQVFAFDIQEEATRSTRALNEQMGFAKRVEVIHEDHSLMDRYVGEPVSFIMFNLGYLPGSDHRITTAPRTTIDALEKAIGLLGEGGCITLVCYTGHPGGLQELQSLKEYLAGIPQNYLEVIEVSFLNQLNNPAVLLLLNKLNGGIR
ncbi:MAG: class I SAM-dependent methyltransferase [Syntrophomonadaceae bacterium]